MTGTDRPSHLSDSMRKYSIKEEMVEEELTAGPKVPQTQKHMGNKASTDIVQSKKELNMNIEDDEYEIDLEEVEQKMKDELDDEVNKKMI